MHSLRWNSKSNKLSSPGSYEGGRWRLSQLWSTRPWQPPDEGFEMASHVRTERHTAARNTILFWLAGVILFAGIGILLTYHALRDSSLYANTMTPLMSERDQTRPASTLKAVQVRQQTDAAADIARAHSSAVASAKSGGAPAPDAPANAAAETPPAPETAPPPPAAQ